MSRIPPVIALIGATAVGKTNLAIALARAIGGEIIGCDSRQVYRSLDIGTGKPSAAELDGVTHHMLDVAGPNEHYTAQQYIDTVRPLLASLQTQQIPAIITVGTGMYYEALIYGLLTAPAVDDETSVTARAHVAADSSAVYALIQQHDPASAARIASNDPARITRWLEVFLATGQPMEAFFSAPRTPLLPVTEFRLERPRPELYARINQRVTLMAQSGLLEEVKHAIEIGYDFERVKVVGYTELLPVLAGELPLEKGVEKIQLHSRRYAKRQCTWFRNRLGGEVLDLASENTAQLIAAILAHLKKTP
ncbi:tRNA (adenosine(37)-N6)-dimethylallyltransferase MiaA [Chrysiogenes arsenatis]|uniref:tRNA (adenosine(37)-N6)-dimethylallyltransferase MiaA n=1 Tax=Chrysiogenes arsenatis TaxID=309797 RepID=UPI00041DE99D|nr:tRNA (adenosine(37)-N6)-dimethylallyltransferase MiaA [Chrysiogenes arsenatis]